MLSTNEQTPTFTPNCTRVPFGIIIETITCAQYYFSLIASLYRYSKYFGHLTNNDVNYDNSSYFIFC